MLKKVKVKSPSNIAFIKYWGQKSKELVLPFSDSFSMNLSNCYSTVEITLHEDVSHKKMYTKKYKQVSFEPATQESLNKVLKFFDLFREYLNIKEDIGFTIKSENSFPQKAGIASSASFFSALAMAFTELFEQKIDKKELSVLARMSGSGSAARSIPDGFVWWNKGNGEDVHELMKSSTAESIASPDAWDLVDLVLILTDKEKKVGSQDGHANAATSSFFADRLLSVESRLIEIREAFDKKDFPRFGKIIEEDSLSMHMVMMTQQPPLYFWSGKTIELMKRTVELREWGVQAYFTIDAGENIHIICEKKNEKNIFTYFQKQPEVMDILVNYPAEGARVVEIE